MERIGDYEVLRQIGAGGMGEVYLAYDPRLERQVAIKRVREGHDSEHHRARFLREAKLAAGFVHPAIVQVFDLLEVDGIDHIVMEYVAGRSLRQVLEEDGPLPLERGLRVGRAVAEALAYAHRHRVVHRDVKADNVVLTHDGQAKVMDFGIARQVLP
ncbi:MAG: serine/threonine-protein kinase, partial [Planctomycetota bacterium]